MNILSSFSSYELRARIAPSLVSIFPFLVSIIIWFPQLLSLGSSIIFILLSFVFLFFIAKIARYLGKKKEKLLLEKWGGFPTEKFLSFSDDSIDIYTKKRYHQNLMKVSEIWLPSQNEELEEGFIYYKDNYRSAIKWLIERTRNNDILFQDAMSYGFCRNLYGLKNVSIFMSIISILINVYNIYIEYGINYELIALKIWATLIFIILFAVFNILYVNENLVKSHSEAYAKSLLRCCEDLK